MAIGIWRNPFILLEGFENISHYSFLFLQGIDLQTCIFVWVHIQMISSFPEQGGIVLRFAGQRG